VPRDAGNQTDPTEGDRMTEAEKSIRRYIVQELMFQKDENVLKEDDSLLERRIIDSAGMMELVGFLEKEYGITIGRTDIIPENFETIRAIGALVKAKSQG
jgi:acyl carrier protein